jgi:hypothetical protein
VKDKKETIKDLEWKLNISSQNSSKPTINRNSSKENTSL